MSAGKKRATLSETAPPAAQADDQSGAIKNLAADVAPGTTDDGSAQGNRNATPQNNTPTDLSQQRQASNRGSWSWRAKASPVAQVARENVSVAGGVSSESAEKRRPSQSVSKSVKGSRKSVPLMAEATKIHATSDVADKSMPPLQPVSAQKKKNSSNPNDPAEEKGSGFDGGLDESKVDAGIEPASLTTAQAMADGNSNADTKSVDARPQSGSWMSWWSRPDGYGSDGEKALSDRATKKPKLAPAEEEMNRMPPPDSPAKGQENAVDKDSNGADNSGEVATVSMQSKPEMATNPSSNRSWFRLWSNAQNEQAAEEERRRGEAEAERQDDNIVTTDDPVGAPPEPAGNVKTGSYGTLEAGKPGDGKLEDEPPKSSGWAFWSADRPKGDPQPSTPGGTHKQIGELAVADTPSQSHPEAAQFNEHQERQKGRATELKKSKTVARSKHGRLEKVQDESGQTTAVATPVASPPQIQTPTVSEAHTPAETPEASPAPVQRGKRPQLRPNIVSPSFRESYGPLPSFGYLERLASYLAQTLHLPGSEPARPPLHPFIAPTPHKVRKAIAIGVHGFFPAAVFQKVLGQPTGTSIRFANYAAASVSQWCQEHQPEIKDVHIEKVALEGEGNISDRVATLWKLLLNWLSHLRQADFILVAAHSQGVPVAIMLVAKLLHLGALAPQVRIGICAMAGINLGPFIEYKSRLFGSTALELFDFCESGSKVSKSYAESMDVCLRHNVRVTFVGSLDDQLVSLESSLHAPLSHPYVSRSIYIDGRVHTSNFLTHLVVFAVKLRNRGISDHGLLREVSAPLAGSLVGGEGHSRVYDDAAVYACATEFALESTDMPVAAQLNSAVREAVGEEEREKFAARRASLSGYPREMSVANNMRRGSQGLALPGIAPVIAQYHANPSQATGSASAVSTMEKNPFVLPWAVRGMLEEEAVRRDPDLQAEVRELVNEFEEWKPAGKGLKDVRWRLEGVRSLL